MKDMNYAQYRLLQEEISDRLINKIGSVNGTGIGIIPNKSGKRRQVDCLHIYSEKPLSNEDKDKIQKLIDPFVPIGFKVNIKYIEIGKLELHAARCF